MYKVSPVALLDSSLASFTRSASRPDKVVDCWPTSMQQGDFPYSALRAKRDPLSYVVPSRLL